MCSNMLDASNRDTGRDGLKKVRCICDMEMDLSYSTITKLKQERTSLTSVSKQFDPLAGHRL